ncbi:MAG: stage II sporulation protein M [Clostridia bacterium]|nr:stage II sporulation protein M [Clostridia bacterium]
MRKHKSISNKVLDRVKKHIIENLKLYIIVAIFFVIGIIAGVICYNSLDEGSKENCCNYIDSFVQNIREGYEVDNNELLRNTIINNIFFTIALWFIGCTIIGLPIVYGMISFKGFSLGYTICCLIGTLGTYKGIIFCFLSLFIQNILAIPAYLGMGVSGNKLYNSIMMDKRKENIKIEILKHTLFCILMLAFLIFASILESYVSASLLQIYTKSV